MNFGKLFVGVAVFIFGAIGIAAYVKQERAKKSDEVISENVEVPHEAPQGVIQDKGIEIDLESLELISEKEPEEEVDVLVEAEEVDETLPDADHVSLLFQKNSPLEIVETISYKPKVDWKKNRSAWLVDYASHYKTHLHFIARSLNERKDYTPKSFKSGDRFNVYKSNIDFYFQLVVDLTRSKMWLYYVLPQKNEHVLLKTYPVGLGRRDKNKASGFLTPQGTYLLGQKTAVFQPKMMGSHKGKKVELIRVFGTRWIPFEKELGPCTEPAKSFGIHGTAWAEDRESGALYDDTSSLGKYESDGCIRLKAEDMEELFAIISSRKAVVEIVSHFSESKIPGKEKVL